MSTKKKIGRPKGRLCREPSDPARVRKAQRIYGAKKSYAAVATALNITRSGARLLLKRWENWS